MKTAFLTFGGFLLLAFLAVQIWLSGFESGYDQGSGEAWAQARASFGPTKGDMIAQIPYGEHYGAQPTR